MIKSNNKNNLRMDLKIFDPTEQGKDKVQVNMKNAKVDSLKDILRKYFG